METAKELKKFTFDVRWVGVGLCLFIDLHLLPAYIVYQLRVVAPVFALIYTVWMFAGIAIVGFFIGYKSRGVTIVEAGVAGVLYSVVLLAATHAVWEAPMKISASLWVYCIFAIATLSAVFGEAIQAMHERKAAG
jgi:hypothetical protein